MPGSLAIPNTFATAPGGTAPVAQLDTNLTTIRDYINNREGTSGTLANRPVAGTPGRWYVATDVAGGTLYFDTGAAWIQVGSGVQTVSNAYAIRNLVGQN